MNFLDSFFSDNLLHTPTIYVFVKQELKGVLKYIGVEIRTHHLAPPTYRDGHRRNPSPTVTDIVGTRDLP